MSRSNIDTDQPAGFPVRRTEIKTWLTEETMSPLGRDLMKIAREIEASDAPALDEEDIEKELRKRKGGYVEDGD
jgi:hypothetical protein